MEKSENIPPWIYKEKPFEEIPTGYYGFVYVIEHIETGQKYIGKKLFWNKAKKRITLKNGKKKNKSIRIESDWKSYFGSSESFLEIVKKYGKHSFKRTILHLCKSKGECSYLEAYEQFANHVLLKDHYFNSWIMVRIRKEHLNNLKDYFPSP